MTNNLTLAKSYNIDYDATIDLNGHNITADVNNSLFNVNGGRLTLVGNGTVSNKKWIAYATNGGQVVIDSGTYVSQNEGFKAVGSGSGITMNGGTVQTIECALGANQGAEIIMNGGLIETGDNMGIGTNGSNGQGGNHITMNGGKIDANITSAGYEAVGVYIANNDTFVMNNGEIIANGGTGICMRAGDVTIAGGSITATGTTKSGAPVADGWIGDKKYVLEGVSAIVYHESANYPGKAGMKLTVTGGTLTGIDHSIHVLSNETEPQVFVTGGELHPEYPESVVDEPVDEEVGE